MSLQVESIITRYRFQGGDNSDLEAALSAQFMGKFRTGSQIGEMLWDLREVLPNNPNSRQYVEQTKMQISAFISGWFLGREALT
jgi:hypothetical protein